MSAWTPPNVGTSTCARCGADLAEKPDKWIVVTPAGAWCASHVKSAPQ